ncbi:uncharacterized protein AB675_10960 [Cyphellophora attinorum]|uniref:Uncharacterized protein n=1 Tax=Cyphellophora attinorum TaxID=1664694 RepID=A0A0N1HHW4_9EURO|nr:uncharacterized protein AB675_10960 [Phialophora attinorum]KPI35500.1 hypothetical protein AB675_10960 [Phialophora attinorum]
MSEPSALDYARYYGLVQRPRHPLRNLTQPAPFDVDISLPAHPEVFNVEDPVNSEKLEISQDGMLFLSNAIRPPFAPQWEQILDNASSRRRLKCELPLLKRNHEKDLQWFRKGLDMDKLFRQLSECHPFADGIGRDVERDLAAAVANTQSMLQSPRLELTKAAMNCAMSMIQQSRIAHKPLQYWDLPARKKTTSDEPKEPLLSLPLPSSTEDDSLAQAQAGLDHPLHQPVDLDELLLHGERGAAARDGRSMHEAQSRLDSAEYDSIDYDQTAHTAPTTTDLPMKSMAPTELSLGGTATTTALSPTCTASYVDNLEDQTNGPKDIFDDFVDFDSFPSTESPVKGDVEHQVQIRSNVQPHSELGTAASQAAAPASINQLELPRLPPAYHLVAVDVMTANLISQLQPYQTKSWPKDGLDHLAARHFFPEQIDCTARTEQYLTPPSKVASSHELLWKQPGLRLLDEDDDEEPLESSLDLSDEVSANPTSSAAQACLSQIGGDVPQHSASRPSLRTASSSTPDPSSIVDACLLQDTKFGVRVEDTKVVQQNSDTPSRSTLPQKAIAATTTKMDEFHKLATAELLEIKTEPDIKSRLGVTQVPAGQKRKASSELLKRETDMSSALAKGFQMPTITWQQPAKRRLIDTIRQTRPVHLNSKGDNPKFSATGALSSFLDLRAGRFKKPSLPSAETSESILASRCSSPLFCPPDVQPSPNPRNTVETELCRNGPTSLKFDPIFVSQASESPPDDQVDVPSTLKETLKALAMDSPTYTPLTHPRVIMLDESLVRKKRLMAVIDRQDDKMLRCVYRRLCSTPDVILSPKVCLLITNLQALKQKSLPGTKSSSAQTIQDRVHILSLQFEQVQVIIALPDPSSASVPGQMETVAEFAACCASIRFSQPDSGTVTPVWIVTSPTTSTQTKSDLDPVTAWIFHLICQHSLPVLPNMSFIDDTTVWETFLRDAGVNALAAQVMLGMLKKDGDAGGGEGSAQQAVSDSGRESWGLGRLVSMSEQARREMFEALVGEKALSRLNRG